MIHRFLLCGLAILFAAASLSGCASGGGVPQMKKLHQQAATMAREGELTPADALKQASDSIEAGRREKLSDFAPSHMEEAEKALEEAKKLHASGAKAEKTITKALLSVQMIEAGRQAKEDVHRTLGDLVAQKEILDSLETSLYFSQELDPLMRRYTELIRMVEQKKGEDAFSRKGALLLDMHHLEIRTVTFKALNSAETILKTLQERRLQNHAPITHRFALAEIEKTKRIIETDPRATERIAEASLQSEQAANHTLHVAQAAYALDNLGNKTREEVILEFENWIHRIGTALKAPDVRYMALSDQAAQISSFAAEKTQSCETRIQRLEELSSGSSAAEKDAVKTIADLETQIQQLKARVTEQEALKEELTTTRAQLAATRESLERQNVTCQELLHRQSQILPAPTMAPVPVPQAPVLPPPVPQAPAPSPPAPNTEASASPDTASGEKPAVQEP